MKLLVLLTTFAAGIGSAATIHDRNQNQQDRIRHGVFSGQLTRSETARLEREQRFNHRQTAIDRFDGGAFTAAERAQAQRRLNQSSRDIARLKHNGRGR
ncbi:MAG TPA: hypothetical protein VGK29_10925 [Paludibaculum sp.]|jgi:hypothetical protein